MPLLALDIPPGVIKSGTNLQQANSWNDSNLVRWHEGSLQPFGGWRKRTASTFTGISRALITYRDNSGNRRTALGTESKLYVVDQTNAIHDITPASFTTGTANAVQNLGWSALTWSASEWGTPRPDTGPYTPVTTWSLDTWGEYLLGCSSTDGKIYQWANNTSNVAAVVTNAPTNNAAIIVTEERFVFALAAGGERDRVEWCDQENNTVWTAAATNQAGGFNLNTVGEIVTGQRVRGGTLIITSTDAHVARYTGPPFVFSFNKVGTGCGAISANASVQADTFACWMGDNGFFMYDGGGVRSLTSTVSEFVFSNMNKDQRSKCFAVLNAQFNEVIWFYPSSDSLENNRYVAWNFRENHWSIGSMSRTAGADIGVFSYPNYASSDGYLYEHEIGFDYDDETIFVESGPVQIGQGDRLMVARSLIPDEKTQGDVSATFKTRNFPNATEESHGPFTMANPTSVRFQGREVSMRIEAAKTTDWRVGTMRLDVVPGSSR